MSTYRGATFAGVFTNTVFGFILAYVLLAVFRAVFTEVNARVQLQALLEDERVPFDAACRVFADVDRERGLSQAAAEELLDRSKHEASCDRQLQAQPR